MWCRHPKPFGQYWQQAKYERAGRWPGFVTNNRKGGTGGKQAADAPTRTLDIVVPTFDAGLTAKKDADALMWPELRRAEANLFAIELKNALERTENLAR